MPPLVFNLIDLDEDTWINIVKYSKLGRAEKVDSLLNWLIISVKMKKVCNVSKLHSIINISDNLTFEECLNTLYSQKLSFIL